jgi:predicted PurR-regulated permease PerM
VPTNPKSRPLLTAAAVIILFAGLKASGELVVPFLLAIVLSVLANPLVLKFRSWKIPAVVSVLLAVAVFGLALALVGGIVGGSLSQFTSAIPRYEAQLGSSLREIQTYLSQWGLSKEAVDLQSTLNPAAAMAFVGQLLNGLVGLFSNFVLIALTMIFLLLEAADFRYKLTAAWGHSWASGNGLHEAAAKVQRYLALKTLVSLATGFSISLWTNFMGLDFPLLWGLIAFLLNYVPSIGSIIAALPAVLLALVQLGGMSALGVGLGFVVVNMVLGNVVEPRLMGRSLGLSPLVVFLSLLFWGWLWGPAGMLLSVPLTVIAKILLEASDGGRPIAVLLGPVQEARERISNS